MADIFIKEKRNNFLSSIRNYFSLRKLKKLLKKYPVIFDEIDEKNIEEVIRNKKYSDKKIDLNGFDNALTVDEVVNTVIDFYYSISSEMGDTIKNLYNEYKDKIFIEEPHKKDINGNLIDTKSEASVGATYNPSYPIKKKMPDGTVREVVCDIELCQNYTTYYTVAHEFMHLMQHALGNENEKLAEVNTKFIEYLFGEYLADKGIIKQEDVDNHNLASNSQQSIAYRLKDILSITKLAKENKLTQYNLLNEIGCSPESLDFRLNGIINSITGEEIYRPKNDIRFVNGMVGANKLLELYNQDKDTFKKVYGRVMSAKYQGQFDFEHFFTDLETAITIEKTNDDDETNSSNWKRIEWNDKIFYMREIDNLPQAEPQLQSVKTNQESDIDENGRKRRPIRIRNIDEKSYKSRTTILMLNKNLELLGVSEVMWEDGNPQAKLSLRNHNEAKNPTLMNLPPEIEHLDENLYNEYGGGNAIQVKANSKGSGLGSQLMYFLISYLKHKKLETLKVNGYAMDKNGDTPEEFYLKTGAKKIDDTSSIYENFDDVLERIGSKIFIGDKESYRTIDDEVFEKEY